MKIAFWTNVKDKCAVSPNMAAISVASVSRFPYRIIAMENHLCPIPLGRAFGKSDQRRVFLEVGTNYYEGGGIEGLLRRIYRGNDQDITLQFYLKEIINKHLYYIPQSRVITSEIFDYELNACLQGILQLIEDNSDICFIDTASQSNLTTKTILEESDLIVVNLSQDPFILKDFLENYSSIIPKSIFIINNYVNNSALNTKRISRMFEIPMDKLVTIPASELYQEAYHHGCVVEFISSNYHCNREHPNHNFIQAIKKAAFTIIKNAELIGNLDHFEMNQCGR